MEDNQINDQNTKIADLLARLKTFRDERGWEAQDPKDMAVSLVLEASELLEHFQWKTGDEVIEEGRLYGAIADELADVLWWIMTMADRLHLDVSQAFIRKMKKNAAKYPVAIFNPNISQEVQNREYYKIKAATRGGHPLAETEKNET
jgi:NTP pyrophosphatase (non-canonical NTP hydrolase)